VGAEQNAANAPTGAAMSGRTHCTMCSRLPIPDRYASVSAISLPGHAFCSSPYATGVIGVADTSYSPPECICCGALVNNTECKYTNSCMPSLLHAIYSCIPTRTFACDPHKGVEANRCPSAVVLCWDWLTGSVPSAALSGSSSQELLCHPQQAICAAHDRTIP
jgi:hypothetical protein